MSRIETSMLKSNDRDEEDKPLEYVPPTAPAHAKLFAFGNRKKRFFVASKLNRIAGLAVEHVMFDTGCGSVLFPLSSTTDIEQLITADPTKENFRWSIRGASTDTGINSALTLCIIAADKSNYFEVVIGEELPIVFRTEVKKIRFHLCLDDVVFIKRQVKSGNILLENKDSVDYLNNFRDHYPVN